MNRISAVVLSATALTVVAIATAAAQDRPAPAANLATSQSAAPSGVRSEPPLTPLFMVGGVVAHLWAPVEAPYDASANRNFNADPLWEARVDH